jgi:hypothetical protein
MNLRIFIRVKTTELLFTVDVMFNDNALQVGIVCAATEGGSTRPDV